MTELVRYDAMCRAIAEAHAIDEIKDMRNKALALEAYARQAKNTEAERKAREIRVRAEQRCGELLKALTRAKTPNPAGVNQHEVTSGRATQPPSPYAQALADNQLSRQQANEYERLAEVPAEVFERELKTQHSPTAASIIYAHAPQTTPVEPVSAEALWLWGRLRDFERDGLLDLRPCALMATMTAPMRADVHRLAPCVSVWLTQIREEDHDQAD